MIGEHHDVLVTTTVAERGSFYPGISSSSRRGINTCIANCGMLCNPATDDVQS
jgi:hypothetical protein